MSRELFNSAGKRLYLADYIEAITEAARFDSSLSVVSDRFRR
jgi:hypothetical protein